LGKVYRTTVELELRVRDEVLHSCVQQHQKRKCLREREERARSHGAHSRRIPTIEGDRVIGMRKADAALSRRCVLAAVSLLSTLAPVPPARAVDGESKLLLLPAGSRVRETVEAALRPPVRALPRRRLAQEFAVLLMRSSYAVADELDFVAMNEFQKDQFLFRQKEWDPYRAQLPKVTQGDLTDPAYFDFMSLCQYATIASGMRNGKLLFEGAPPSVSMC
jgi:hypothetical protein